MASKRFHLGDILSITTDYLVSPSGMDAVYGILNHATRDNLFTHQLPRASRECKPWFLRQHPQLAGIDTSALEAIPAGATREDRERIVYEWLAPLVARFGETLPIEPIPRDDHDVIDPVSELVRMRGGSTDGIVVVDPDREPID